MDTVDLTPKIRERLLGRVSVTSIIQDRLFSPERYSENGEEQPNPKVSFRQMGGATGYHRYLFLVEADHQKQARELAILIKNLLCGEALGFDDVNVEYVYSDGGLVDVQNDDNKKPQVMFYVNFELYEF